MLLLLVIYLELSRSYRYQTWQKTDISSLRTIWCMSQTSTLYSRGDILRYKNVSNSIKGLQILNRSLLEELSRQSNKGLKAKTQIDTRAGRRKKRKPEGYHQVLKRNFTHLLTYLGYQLKVNPIVTLIYPAYFTQTVVL